MIIIKRAFCCCCTKRKFCSISRLRWCWRKFIMWWIAPLFIYSFCVELSASWRQFSTHYKITVKEQKRQVQMGETVVGRGNERGGVCVYSENDPLKAHVAGYVFHCHCLSATGRRRKWVNRRWFWGPSIYYVQYIRKCGFGGSDSGWLILITIRHGPTHYYLIFTHIGRESLTVCGVPMGRNKC